MTYWDQWATFFDEDIARAATFLGISKEEFASKYHLIDDVSVIAESMKLTRDRYLEKLAHKKSMTVDEMVKSFPMLRAKRLRIKDSQCPFLINDNRCSIYEVRPKICASYPTQEQRERLNEQGEHFYAPYCPGFEQEKS